MPPRLALAGLLVTAALFAPACFAVDIEDGAVACGEAGCPAGLECGADGLCYRDPADGDLGPGGPADDPSVDTPTCAVAMPTHPCVELPYLEAPPTIDGQPDCGLALQPMSTEHWQGQTGGVPADHSAEVGAAWRPDGIYVFVVVREPELDPARSDEPVWRGDAVEIYLDDDGVFGNAPLYDNPGTRQLVAAGPEAGGVARRGAIYADAQHVEPWDPQSFIALATGGGYAVEAFVRTDALGGAARPLVGGQLIGFDLAINISRDSARQGNNDDYLGQYFMRVAGTGSPWPYDNVAAFCTPTLLAP